MKRKKSYTEWINEVNAAVIKKSGLSVYDLPDQPYRDWYDSGKTAKGAASAALKAEDF
jgi:hypothetical protein